MLIIYQLPVIKKLSVSLFCNVSLFGALRHCTEISFLGSVILRVEVMLEFAGMSPILTDVRLTSSELGVTVSGGILKAV